MMVTIKGGSMIKKRGGVDRRGASSWLRQLFPSRLAHIPSEAELTRHRDDLTKIIVMQHAEGSVLLGEGKFEIVGDLLAEDCDKAGVEAR